MNETQFLNNYNIISNSYAALGIVGTMYLGYRDLPFLTQKYALQPYHEPVQKTIKVLDYGCGTGRSTRFLKNMNSHFKVDGVDKSASMLQQAEKLDSSGHYFLMTSEKIPAHDQFYDRVYSVFVLFEIESKEKMRRVFQQIARVLKPNSLFIAVTGTTHLYNQCHQWLTYDANFPENITPQSGDEVKLYIREGGTVINDIYWTEADYEEVFQISNMKIIEKMYNLGRADDPFQWKAEASHAPFVTYVIGV